MKASTCSLPIIKIDSHRGEMITRDMKFFRALNCFFVTVLFSAGALAQEQVSPAHPSGQQRSGDQPSMQTKNFGLVVHGGAGTIERSKMTPEREREYRAGIERALSAGYEILKRGGSGLDATEAAVRVFEDDPHFNAGRGSVFTNIETNELDAAIMDGKTLGAGAVANLRHIKNPILLARLVMEKSPHVLMAGEGAEAFAKENGIEIVDQKYFYTKERWDALKKVKGRENQRSGREKIYHLRSRSTWYRRGCRARSKWESCGSNFNGRDDQQARRARGRFTGHRRRHLRE